MAWINVAGTWCGAVLAVGLSWLWLVLAVACPGPWIRDKVMTTVTQYSLEWYKRAQKHPRTTANINNEHKRRVYCRTMYHPAESNLIRYIHVCIILCIAIWHWRSQVAVLFRLKGYLVAIDFHLDKAFDNVF